MSFPWRINEYRCDECLGKMVTIDVDQGDTPYLMECLLRVSKQVDATERVVGSQCGGRCVSALYDCDQKQAAIYKWVRAVPNETLRSARGINAYHNSIGQLVLKPR